MTGRNHTRVCEVCGEAYMPRLTRAGVPRKTRRNACNLCSHKIHHRKIGELKAPASFVCKTCGNKYRPSNANNNSFCSEDCISLWSSKSKKYQFGPVNTVSRCMACGNDFESELPRKFCSKEHNRFFHKNKHRYMFGPVLIVMSATCITCGNKYRPTRNDNTHFCSRKCLKYWHSHSDKYKFGPVYNPPSCNVDPPVLVGPCEVCGKYAITKKRAMALCDRHAGISLETKLKLRRGNFVVSCPVCHVEFCRMPGLGRGSGGDRTCGDPSCKIKRADDVKRRNKRLTKAKRRARKRSVLAESIDPIAVFERDRWKCHICGKLTLKSKRGTSHDRAPELEHIVSLADGGTHTWSNVACSCRKCNGDKGAASFGQINLGFSL